MQTVPAANAASASLPAPPAVQAAADGMPDAFGQMLLAMLTGAPVGTEAPVAAVENTEQAHKTETEDATRAEGATTDSPAMLAAVSALLAQYVVAATPAPQPQADADPAAAAAVQPTAVQSPAAQPGVGTAPVEAEYVAVDAVVSPVVGATVEEAPDTEPQVRPFLAALAEADTSTATAAEGDGATEGPDRADAPTAAAAATVGRVKVQVTTDPSAGERTGNVAEKQAAQAAKVTGPTETDLHVQPDAGDSKPGEAYARVAAAKRFATTASDASTPAVAASADTPRVALPAAPQADVVPDRGIRPAELIDRIAGQIRVTAEAGGGEAKLQLQPESLGHLEISVKVQDGQVSVSLRAETPAVQHALASRLDDLVSALTASGMTVAQANVDVGDQPRRQQSWAQDTGYVASEAGDDATAGSSPIDWLQPMSMLNLSA